MGGGDEDGEEPSEVSEVSDDECQKIFDRLIDYKILLPATPGMAGKTKELTQYGEYNNDYEA